MATTLWFTKSSVLLGLGFFPVYMEAHKGLMRGATKAEWAYTMRPGSDPTWCTLYGALWVPSFPSCAQSPPFP
jgi:hypothetical protein